MMGALSFEDALNADHGENCLCEECIRAIDAALERPVAANRVYRGVNISHTPTPGARLPWSAYLGDRFVVADTLDGIKQTIREHQKERS
jgi:hypothetical protein